MPTSAMSGSAPARSVSTLGKTAVKMLNVPESRSGSSGWSSLVREHGRWFDPEPTAWLYPEDRARAFRGSRLAPMMVTARNAIRPDAERAGHVAQRPSPSSW